MREKKIERFTKAVEKNITTIKMALGMPINPCDAKTLKETSKIVFSSSMDSERYIVAMRKWRDLSLDLTKRAKTAKEAWNVYIDSVAVGSLAAFQKWEKLSISEIKKVSTFEEIYGDLGWYAKALRTRSVAVQIATLKRARQLCLEKLKKVSTFEDAKKLLPYASQFTKTEDAVLKKMYKLFK